MVFLAGDVNDKLLYRGDAGDADDDKAVRNGAGKGKKIRQKKNGATGDFVHPRVQRGKTMEFQRRSQVSDQAH